MAAPQAEKMPGSHAWTRSPSARARVSPRPPDAFGQNPPPCGRREDTSSQGGPLVGAASPSTASSSVRPAGPAPPVCAESRSERSAGGCEIRKPRSCPARSASFRLRDPSLAREGPQSKRQTRGRRPVLARGAVGGVTHVTQELGELRGGSGSQGERPTCVPEAFWDGAPTPRRPHEARGAGP